MGISEDFSFYLVSFANAGGGVGRLVVGLLADKFGGFTHQRILLSGG